MLVTSCITAGSGQAVAAPAACCADRDEPVGGAPVADDVPVIRFVNPLPGFPGLDTFVLVQVGLDAEQDGGAGDGQGGGAGDGQPPAEPVLYELRSVQQPEVRFLVAVPTVFFPAYAVELDDSACTDLGLSDADDALVLVILTVGVDPAPTTANLMAPVVLNARTRAAAQVILSGTDWPVRATVA